MGDDRYRVARSFDVLEKAASNEGGAGALASAGVGLGFGIGMAPLMGQAVQQATASSVETCVNCGRPMPNDAIFCPHCGSPKKRLCPNCNKEVGNGISFCPYCGTKLS